MFFGSGGAQGSSIRHVEVGADHAVFARRLRRALQPLQLLAGTASTSGGIFASAIAFSRSASSCLLEPSSPSSRWIDAICSRSSISRWRVSSDALVWLADLGRELEDLEAMGEQLRHLVEALQQLGRLEKLLLLLGRDIEIGRGEVGQQAGRRGRLYRLAQLGRRLRQEVEHLLHLALQTRKRASSSEPVAAGSGTCRPRASRKGWPSMNSVSGSAGRPGRSR